MHAAQLLEDLLAGRLAARRLEALQRVVALLDLRLDVEGDLGEELLPARWVRGRLDARHRLLGGLDRTARIGERDRHPGHQRGPHDPRPLLLLEVTLGGHSAVLPRLTVTPASSTGPRKRPLRSPRRVPELRVP